MLFRRRDAAGPPLFLRAGRNLDVYPKNYLATTTVQPNSEIHSKSQHFQIIPLSFALFPMHVTAKFMKFLPQKKHNAVSNKRWWPW
jgi:hypothetical protein